MVFLIISIFSSLVLRVLGIWVHLLWYDCMGNIYKSKYYLHPINK